MAGDLKIEEQVIIVPPQVPELSDNLAESLRQEGVRVLHRYGPRVMIGEVPEGQTQRVRAALNAMEVAAAPDAGPGARAAPPEFALPIDCDAGKPPTI